MRRSPNILWFFLIALTLIIGWGLGPDFYDALRSRTWTTVPCRILRSHVFEEPSNYGMRYVLRVEYAYPFAGRDYRSTRFGTGQNQDTMDVARAGQAAVRFAEGKEAVCFVNPQNPSEAVLERGNLWGGLFLLGPLLIIGLMGQEQIFAWFGKRRRNRRAVLSPPISELNDALGIDGRYVLFGVMGLVMGTLLLGMSVARPLSDWRRTRSWMEADATILHSELISRSGIHGPEYSLEVVFEYEVNGKRYRSDKAGLGFSIEAPVADMSDWVAAHPAGARMRCFVNPQDPTEAVLDRHLRLEWISPALGLLMMGFGLFLFAGFRRTWRLRKQLAGDVLAAYWQGKVREGTATFRVFPPVWVPALGCLAAALICAPPGIWSLSKFVRALSHGQTDLINLLYGIFALAGVGYFICLGWKYLVQVFKPRPILEVTPAALQVGRPFEVHWNFSGRAPRGWMRLWLDGVEEARVRRLIHAHYGSISEEKTERFTFKSILLAEVQADPARAGRADGRVPAETMHSFKGVKGGVTWQIRIEFGDRKTEKLEHKFPITVTPDRR
jgi:hypothetical protein